MPREEPSPIVIEGDRARLAGERDHGVTTRLQIDAAVGWILGLYSAVGAGRAGTIELTLTGADVEFAPRLREILSEIAGEPAQIVGQPDQTVVTVKAPTAALLLEALCGRRAVARHVPTLLFSAGREAVQGFVDGFVQLGGYRHPDGTITVSSPSEELTWGLFGLLLKLGFMPAFHRYGQRAARGGVDRFVLRWNAQGRLRTGLIEDEQYIYVPLREVGQRPFDGPVFDLEIAEDHGYLVHGAVAHDRT